MLGARIASAVILIPFVLVMLYLSPETTAITAAVGAVIGIFEFYNMSAHSPARYHPLYLPGFVCGIFLTLAALLGDFGLILIPFAIVLFGVLAGITLWLRQRTKQLEPTPQKLGWDWLLTIFAPIYVGLPLSLITFIRQIEGQDKGFAWITLAFIGTWGTDTAAYFAGRFFGKHKLAPRISPKKTIEGAIGGVALGVVGTVLVGSWLLGLQWYFTVPLGFGVAIVSILGDLFESWVKRRFDTKDLGKIIPGHGGLLDRIDSFLAVSVLVFVFFEIQQFYHL